MAKMIPAKVLKDTSGKGVTHYLKDSPVEYYIPSLEEVRDHLAKESSFAVLADADSKEWAAETGLPPYENETSAWLVKAINGLARGKAAAAFRVNGDTPATLALEITGTLPTCMEDLLTSERSGGAFFTQKAEFLKAFAPWITLVVTQPKMFISALSRASMSATPREGWPIIEEVLEKFVTTLDDEAPYAVYLRAVRNQLHAEEEVEDWSAADMFKI